MKAVVLAGERPGGSSLATAVGVRAGVLAPVAGRSSILRVIDTLRAAEGISGGVIAGPNVEICRGSDTLRAIFDAGDFAWMAPQEAPAESVLRATEEIGEFPVLATTGDHALLRPQTVDQFIADAGSSPADAQVGLVPYDRVLQRFPGAKRTRLRFRDGGFCGSNLFLFRNAKALGAVRFWSTVQRDRKRPWRIARRLGAGVMLRYLVGRLAIDSAFSVLSRVAGCHITWVEVEDERAAVDVDTVQDLALAERILG